MDVLNNLDLFSVGLAIASSFILGFTVFFNNRNSLSNRTFLNFCFKIKISRKLGQKNN